MIAFKRGICRLSQWMMWGCLSGLSVWVWSGATTAVCAEVVSQASERIEPTADTLELNPEILEGSPVLQRWLEAVPDLLSEIANDPSFRTRVRLGYSHFAKGEDEAGWNVGVEDIFIGQTGFTLSGDYQDTFDGDRTTYGLDLRYYLRPLGRSLNFAPVVGCRHMETDADTTNGVNVGARVLLVLSRTGAADISLTQTWVAPTTEEAVSLTTLSVGYALTPHLRLATDFQRQDRAEDDEHRLGIVLEWMQ